MLTADALIKAIVVAMVAHDTRARSEENRVRRWDGVTPYGIHPIWCAMTLLHETGLPEEIRVNGALALLWHDLLEDTAESLPEGTLEKVRLLVEQLTFASTEEEYEHIWERPVEVQLYKLYDKSSNKMDAAYPMAEGKRARKDAHLLRLAAAVEAEYGTLNIVKIARALVV
jgi:hypothetical protein